MTAITLENVRVHDFIDKELGKAIPYGVYDLASNEGWVSVGITHDTARFAVASIRRWWTEMGAVRFPRARKLMITADGGGSNSSRNRLWKVALQELADELELRLQVCHFPPGTSKWNKIEHRMFSFITQNWRGKPLVSHQAIVNLIASTTTRAGLTVKAALDSAHYETQIKISIVPGKSRSHISSVAIAPSFKSPTKAPGSIFRCCPIRRNRRISIASTAAGSRSCVRFWTK